MASTEELDGLLSKEVTYKIANPKSISVTGTLLQDNRMHHYVVLLKGNRILSFNKDDVVVRGTEITNIS